MDCGSPRGRTDDARPLDSGKGGIATSLSCASVSLSILDLDDPLLERKIGRLRWRTMVPDCLCSDNNRGPLYPWCADGLCIPLEETRFTFRAPLHGSSAAIGIYGHPFFGVVAGHVTTWR